MANIPTTQLWIEDSLYLYLLHYKWGGEEYSSSTVLVDPWYNIIAFFDNKTKDIFAIQAWLDFRMPFIIWNGKKIKTTDSVKYKPLDYDMIIEQRKDELEEIKRKKAWEEKLKAFYKSVRDYVDNYNINYFTELWKEISSKK